jgi:hypothetical protein
MTHISNASYIFFQFKVIKALDPDRIGIYPKKLDPDPDEMNADPQPCFQAVHISDPGSLSEQARALK